MSDTENSDKQDGHSSDPPAAADPIIGEAVGSRLKSLFDEFANEEVPDRFLDLIGQLEQNEKSDNGDDDVISVEDVDSPARGSGKADT